MYIEKQGTAMGTRMAPQLCNNIHKLLRIKFVKQVNIETQNTAQIHRLHIYDLAT